MKLLSFALLLLAAPAFASDVLFLDMNASFHEIEAAKAAAKKAGRGFVAFPPMSDADRKTFFDKNAAMERLANSYGKECGSAGPRCDAYKEKMKNARADVENLKAKFEINRDKLKKFLNEQDAAGRKFGSVVVSGHDGTGSISGRLGAIGDRAMAELFGESTAIKDSLRSLYLWGCYTASPSGIILNWKSQFPYLNLIAGYDGRAPLSDKPAGWKYLAGALEKEQALHAISDSKKLQEALKKIPFARQVHSAMATCDSYANLKDHFRLSDYTDKCEDIAQKLKARASEYECFLRADKPGCENPPADTGAGALRQFYQLVQESEACREISQDPIFRFNRATTMNLLFYRGVVGNLTNNYQELLRESDKMLADLGAPADLRLAELDKLSRKDALARLDQLLAFARSKMPDLATDPAKIVTSTELAQVNTLPNLQVSLTSVLSELGERCVPFNWHEAGARETSDCIDQTNLGQAGVVSSLENAESLKSSLHRTMLDDMVKDLEKRAAAPARDPNIDDLVFDARLTRLQAAMGGSQPVYKAKVAEARMAWAEELLRLREEKAADPLAQPSAKAKQYGFRVAELDTLLVKSEEEISGLASNPFVPKEELARTQAMLENRRDGNAGLRDIARLMEARYAGGLSGEKLTENEKAVAEAAARAKGPLLEYHMERHQKMIAAYQQMLAQQAASLGRDTVTTGGEVDLQTELKKLEALVEKQKSDPEGFFQTLVKETVEDLPKAPSGND